MEPILLNKKESCRVLGDISVRALEYLIARGELKVRRIGRRVFIDVREIQRFARRDHPTRSVGEESGGAQ